MAGEVLVDALPYIDFGYDEPGVKQSVNGIYSLFVFFLSIILNSQTTIQLQALALVEEECRRYKPTKNYLDFLGPINLHSFEVKMSLIEAQFKAIKELCHHKANCHFRARYLRMNLKEWKNACQWRC